MIASLGVLIFTGAFMVSVAVIAVMIAPQWRRIVRLASGRIEPSFQPLARLAMVERRIRLSRWASVPVAKSMSRLRGAA